MSEEEQLDLNPNKKISFEESHFNYIDSNRPKMVQWVINHSAGLIKDERQALIVLVAFLVLSVVIFLFLISKSNPSLPPQPPTPFEEGVSI